MPESLLVEEPAPAIDLADGATVQQVIEDGIRPLHQWGAEGWARLHQVRLLQQQCR